MAGAWDTPPTETERVTPGVWDAPPKPEEAIRPEAHSEPVTLGAGATGAMHFLRQESLGLGDKLVATVQALQQLAAEKTGKHTFSELYRGNLGFNDRLMEDSDAAHPVARWAGNAGGFLTGAAALGAPALLQGAGTGAAAQLLPRAVMLRQAALQGAKTGAAVGAAGGYGADRSNSTLGTLANTLLGGGLGLAAGAGAPYAADSLGRGASYLGDRAQDLAGWLKVNSIHPTPTLGEAMEGIPGGVPAVGRELLARNVGGLTKAGTAKQIAAAFDEATGVANRLASAHDAAGGAPVDLGQALQGAQAKAEKLMAEPATREAGQKLQSLVAEYADKYGAGEAAPATAEEALASKRALGAIGYGARTEFKLNKNPVVGDYGAGVRQLERGADSALDSALGPKFEDANVLVRRLGGAKDAAERAAARTVANHLMGLIPAVAGVGGAVGGHMTGQAGPEALALGIGAMLAGKYGAQVGARTLYSLLGGGLNLAGRGLQALPGTVASGVAAEGTAPLAADLARFLPHRPAMAERDARQRALAQMLAQGAP